MKYITNFFFILSLTLYCQESIEASFIKSSSFKAETLVTIDNFETSYFINNNIFHKKDTNQTITYNNLQLGNITSADAFNPLRINLFYQNFNTIVILDNRLAEIFKIDFNSIQPYKNVSHISNGFDNTLWIFNQDTQQVELYDYKSNNSRALTQPIKSKLLNLKSNYNTCWLLTEKYLYKYNYFGNLIEKIKNNGYTDLAENNGNIILKKENTLYFLKKDSSNIIPIILPNLLINQFFVTNETLYIYNNGTLQQFQLKIN